MADASNDFAALARQYMALWGDAMRGVAAPPPVDPGLQGMRDMLEAWMRQAGSTDAFGPALAHFNRQFRGEKNMTPAGFRKAFRLSPQSPQPLPSPDAAASAVALAQRPHSLRGS